MLDLDTSDFGTLEVCGDYVCVCVCVCVFCVCVCVCVCVVCVCVCVCVCVPECVYRGKLLLMAVRFVQFRWMDI
jgi:hypothetical protein